jgi:hypothetical protein
MNVVSSMTDPVLVSRLVSGTGNVGLNTSWQVHGLAEGEYYWSVQAIGANRATSDFSAEQSFEIGSDEVLGDLNSDSVVNTSDLLLLLSMWGQPVAFPDADLNSDGAIDVSDLLVLLAQWD